MCALWISAFIINHRTDFTILAAFMGIPFLWQQRKQVVKYYFSFVLGPTRFLLFIFFLYCKENALLQFYILLILGKLDSPIKKKQLPKFTQLKKINILQYSPAHRFYQLSISSILLI